MLFNTFEFIFIFLPVVFIVYFVINKIGFYNLSKIWLILCSVFFYSWWNVSFIFILIISIVFNFFLGRILNNNNTPHRKALLTLGILINILNLSYFKYSDFFIVNINTIFRTSINLLNLALPLAISFFTFQQIAYLIDGYRREIKNYNFIDYTLFVTFFPQLIAGPIVYHKEIFPQFVNNSKKVNFRNLTRGLFIFIVGLFKKIVIADTFGQYANTGYGNYVNLSTIESWFTTLSYTFQLYFDFSGYSDMAIGLALMFNIRLPINFNSPYKALDIQDFWKRWHITLSSFLTKYIYIPLGGNRKGVYRTYINIMIIFIISGFWHGAGWTFVFWGALHGIAMCINRIWKNYNIKLPKIIAWFITFNFVNIAWIFFRAEDMNQAFVLLKNMFNTYDISTTNIIFSTQQNEYAILNSNLSIFLIILATFIVIFMKNTNQISCKRNYLLIDSILLSLAIAIMLFMSFEKFNNSIFIYFNF